MQAAQSISTTKPRESGGVLTRLANNQALLGFLFILPSLIGFTVFYAIPAIRSVFISFQDWNLLSAPKYVGLGNYQDIFADKRFWFSLQVTVQYVLLNIPLQTVLAVFIAVMLERVQDSSWLRALFIFPWLLPGIVVG